MLNILLYAICIVLLIMVIIGMVFKKTDRKTSTIMLVVAIVIWTLASSFTIINTGYTGVKITFGQIDSTVLQSGFNAKIPLIQSIRTVNNKQQDKKYGGEIWGEAGDKTAVFAKDVIVTYYINPEKSAYIYSNVKNYKDNLIPQTLVNSAIKSAMVQLDSNTVTNRSKIEPLAKEMLEKAVVEKYGDNTIIVLKVTIDGMDFEDSYNKAIADKQIARQEAEKQAIENQKAVDLARANREKADVEAETKKIQAQADAEAMLITARAEADAYRVKSAEITENLLKKWELDARKEHGWITVQGANTIVTGQ